MEGRCLWSHTGETGSQTMGSKHGLRGIFDSQDDLGTVTKELLGEECAESERAEL